MVIKRKYITNFLVSLFIISLVISNLFSAIPLATDDIYTVKADAYELEITYENFKEINAKRNFLTFTLKGGLTKRIDLGVATLYQIHPYIEERFKEVFLGFKFNLLEEILSISINNRLGSSSCFLNLILSRNFKALKFHLNLGYNSPEEDNISSGEMFCSSAFEFEYKRFCFLGEIISNGSSLQNYLLGIRFKFLEGHFITFGFENSFKLENNRFILGLHSEF